ncbi:hypothetical protein KC19_1G250900 [Ceratodon purpureus]|uniref:Uncharacterized protein n=1 Tax=Ceratodon purpureus TaxID=3225 RepID=A0A8T0J943_CERPU|nr:hypothetical protein KC19_1G250900 [Ceratodon purpureus]
MGACLHTIAIEKLSTILQNFWVDSDFNVLLRVEKREAVSFARKGSQTDVRRQDLVACAIHL